MGKEYDGVKIISVKTFLREIIILNMSKGNEHGFNDHTHLCSDRIKDSSENTNGKIVEYLRETMLPNDQMKELVCKGVQRELALSNMT